VARIWSLKAAGIKPNPAVIEGVDETLGFLDLLAEHEQAPKPSDCSMLEKASVSPLPPPSHLEFVGRR
jgi:hypothetical protein